MSQVTIRKAGREDMAAYLGLVRALAAYEGFDAYVQTSEQSLLRDGFGHSPLFGVLLAEAQGQAVGYVSYTIAYSIWGAGQYLHVDDVYVSDALRGAGVGQLLMKAVAQECVRGGYLFARWAVERDNAPARGFYSKIGAQYKEKGLCTWMPAEMAAFLAG